MTKSPNNEPSSSTHSPKKTARKTSLVALIIAAVVAIGIYAITRQVMYSNALQEEIDKTNVKTVLPKEFKKGTTSMDVMPRQ